MSALNWLRNKVEIFDTDTFKLEDSRNVCVVRKSFKGNLPPRMVAQLRKELKTNPLANTETIRETLLLGGQYRSDYGKCEFFQTEYKFI